MGVCGCGRGGRGGRVVDGVQDRDGNWTDDPDRAEQGLCGFVRAGRDPDGAGVLDWNDY